MLATAGLRALMRGRGLLTGRELLVMWCLMVLLSGIAWTGLARTFFINLTAPFYFATVENRWTEVLLPRLPEGWYPAGAEAVDALLQRDRGCAADGVGGGAAGRPVGGLGGAPAALDRVHPALLRRSWSAS